MKFLIFAATVATAMMSAGAAQAAVIFDINETATGILFNASGTFDKSLATSTGNVTNAGNGSVRGSSSRLILGTGAGTSYSFNSSLNIGNGTTLSSIANTSGIVIGFIPSYFFIDNNYISNTAISSTGAINGKTLAGAGLTAGTYNYTIGGNAMTINIKNYVAPTPDPIPTTPLPVSAVPEPATWAMMLVGFGFVGSAMRQRKQRAAVRFA